MKNCWKVDYDGEKRWRGGRGNYDYGVFQKMSAATSYDTPYTHTYYYRYYYYYYYYYIIIIIIIIITHICIRIRGWHPFIKRKKPYPYGLRISGVRYQIVEAEGRILKMTRCALALVYLHDGIRSYSQFFLHTYLVPTTHALSGSIRTNTVYRQIPNMYVSTYLYNTKRERKCIPSYFQQ